jgi:hypothetical protein
MTNGLAPVLVQKFFDNNGNPLANGQLFSYQAGTTTKLATYSDSVGTVNSNPIRLDARGECRLWTPPNVAYAFTLAYANDTDPPTNPIWTVDQVVNSQLLTLYGGVDTGAVNAYVLTFSANFSSYTDGTVVYWTPAHTNTGPSTLNINGIGPANIYYPDGVTTLFGGELVANQTAEVIVSGGKFLLISSTYIAGSFTPAWSGFSVAPTGAMLYQIVGNQVTLKWTGTTGTSNLNQMSIGNVPVPIRISGASLVGMVPAVLIDNSNRVVGSMGFGGTSTFQFNMGSPLSPTGFTNTGTKGLDSAWSVTYTR